MANENDTEWIVKDPKIRGGSPTIKGTRIQVTDVVEQILVALVEVAMPKLLAAYPHLTEKQVWAALNYFRDHPELLAERWREERDIIAGLKEQKRGVKVTKNQWYGLC